MKNIKVNAKFSIENKKKLVKVPASVFFTLVAMILVCSFLLSMPITALFVYLFNLGGAGVSYNFGTFLMGWILYTLTGSYINFIRK